MLKLSNIKKSYKTGETQTEALKGITLEFRKAEFVSILGPSGCGKTTLLNIVGGLDRYSTGDLSIDGKSTKEYKDRDWDNYRNHSVGFVFQSYNLIPHQTVLENVELALTLSGVSKKERRERATEVLTKVGLKDKLKNKPSQLSGGQMQRVAIARALVNDPEIILADEPTGALDSKTSVQIMEILKEISKEKLIVMVTHNPELAEKYSSRIIKLKDGQVVDDSKPFSEEDKQKEKKAKQKTKQDSKKKSKMSFWTALSLSFKNLLTKKARTILVSFAGSIGIIGIALVLAISSGFNAYVDKTQRNTLSSYPVEISNNDFNMASLMQLFLNSNSKTEKHDSDKVYVKQELTDLLSNFNQSNVSNDIGSFKEYLDGAGKTEIEKYTTAVQYLYNQGVFPYFYDSNENRYINTNTTDLFKRTMTKYALTHPEIQTDEVKKQRYALISMLFSGGIYFDSGFWSEMIDNQKVLDEQYSLIKGSWPTKANEVVIVLNQNNEISDYTLYGLGLLTQAQLDKLMDDYINERDSEKIENTYSYDEIMANEYKLVLTSDFYRHSNESDPNSNYVDIRQQANYATKIQQVYNNSDITIKISGIIKAKDDKNTSITTCVAYTKALTDFIIERNNQTQLVQDVLNGNIITLEVKITDAEGHEQIKEYSEQSVVLTYLNYIDKTNPVGVNLYPINFEAKSNIVSYINKYNDLQKALGHDDKVITYTDSVGMLMSSISMIISAITYILIAFVSVSLVVSSIMIGIITYISVIERKKEIGVLRSIGASKRDVKHVFTAESFIIGLASGFLGIVISLILLIPINILLNHFTNLGTIAMLPVLGAVVLVVISVLLTFIAGLIPARAAAKKDPVIALREV